MKIKKIVQKPTRFYLRITREYKKVWDYYEAVLPDGTEGIGSTPQKAVLDAKHEYRIMHNNGERCIRGVHHT